MGLNRDKTSKVFCINIYCVSNRFYFFVIQWHRIIQISSKVWMFLIYTPIKPERPILRKRFYGRGVGWMRPDHPSFVPIGPSVGVL